MPADLIVPLATLGSVDGIQVIGEAELDGHDTVQVQMPFSRAGPLFPFLSLGGTWRPFFADDPVTVWLDTTGWYPVQMQITPSPDAARKDWEMRFGLPHEATGTPILDVSLGSVSDSPPDPAVFRIHGRHVVSPVDMPRVFGYTPAEPTAPAPLSLVAAIAPKRAPSAPTSVLLYADGLDYLRVAEDRRWSGPGPFGPIGLDAEQVRLPDVGPALYEPSGDGLGRRLSLHAAGTDLFLESNLSRDELFAIASTLGVHATPLPAPWRVVARGRPDARARRPAVEPARDGLWTPGALSLPDGYVPASATRSVEQGVAVGVTVTFRQRDSDSMGPPLQIHVGTGRDTAIDAAPDPERVSIGTTSGALFPERVGGGVDARGSMRGRSRGMSTSRIWWRSRRPCSGRPGDAAVPRRCRSSRCSASIAGAGMTMAVQGDTRAAVARRPSGNLRRRPTMPETPSTFLVWVPRGLPLGFASTVATLPKIAATTVVAEDDTWLRRSWNAGGELVDHPPGRLPDPDRHRGGRPGDVRPVRAARRPARHRRAQRRRRDLGRDVRGAARPRTGQRA